MSQDIGILIKNYRRERGLSQLDLEMGIGAAAGSFTRIESGKINPSKETLHKVIEFLELNPAHAVKLFGIDMSFFCRIITNVHRLEGVKHLDEVMSIAVNDVREQLGLAGAGFHLVEGNEIRLKSLSASSASNLVRKIVKDPFAKLKFNLDVHRENVLVKAVVKNEIIITDSLHALVSPKMSKWLANRAQKISVIEEIIVLPIRNQGRVIGVVTYGSSSKSQFRFELDLLKSFVAEIGLALERLENNPY